MGDQGPPKVGPLKRDHYTMDPGTTVYKISGSPQVVLCFSGPAFGVPGSPSSGSVWVVPLWGPRISLLGYALRALFCLHFVIF